MSNLKPDRRAGSMFQHTDTDAGLVVVAMVKDTSSLHSDQPLHCSVSSIKRDCDCDLKNYIEFFNPIFIVRNCIPSEVH